MMQFSREYTMIKILFGINSLHIGGIQTALINLLQELDFSKYDVTLQLFHYEDKYLKKLPSNIKVQKATYLIDLANHTMAEAKEQGTFSYLLRGFMALICRTIGAKNFYKFLFLSMNDNTYYDEAISFTNNGNSKTLYWGMNQYILDHVRAKEKSTWVHVDFEKMGLNTPENRKEYNCFDKVIHVSAAAKNTFLKYLPNLSDRSFVIYNLINVSQLELMANKDSSITFFQTMQKGIKIVSVCRLDKNKNVFDCLLIAEKLKKIGITFQWMIIGDGPEKQLLLQQAKGKNIEKDVSFVGYKQNPYPYIKKADIIVSTSLTESYGMALAEAIALHTPAIAYSYPALAEVVQEGKNGYIVKQGDIVGMADIISELYNHPQKLLNLKNHCKNIINSRNILTSFDEVFGGDK